MDISASWVRSFAHSQANITTERGIQRNLHKSYCAKDRFASTDLFKKNSVTNWTFAQSHSSLFLRDGLQRSRSQILDRDQTGSKLDQTGSKLFKSGMIRDQWIMNNKSRLDIAVGYYPISSWTFLQRVNQHGNPCFLIG